MAKIIPMSSACFIPSNSNNPPSKLSYK
jgi:hypothetical protein